MGLTTRVFSSKTDPRSTNDELVQSGVLSEIVVFYCERRKLAEMIAQKRAA
jgi:hypothetical protein